jgi:hypothetical protein
MSARRRSAIDVAAGVAVLAVLALGAMWLGDRAHRWESPTWPRREFVRLRARTGPDDATRATCVIPVNPRCPRCMRMLSSIHATWDAQRPATLVALIVDSSRRPRPETVAGFPPIEVWWDRDGIWRHRWGHRLYGELIEFDGHGRLTRTVTIPDLARRPSAPPPSRPQIPVHRNQAGSGS